MMAADLPTRRRPLLRRMLGDRRGSTIVEFALITPTMLLVIMGTSELAYQAYVQSVLDGAVQKAGRDSSLQGGAQNAATLDKGVVDMLSVIMREPAQSCGTDTGTDATWCATRRNYDNFSSIKPEAFVDKNGNGKYDKGECFEDVNANSSWDQDPGSTGQGGASDVTLYTMRINYPRLFPIWQIAGWSRMQTLSSKTVLKNQPYASQSIITPATVCT